MKNSSKKRKNIIIIFTLIVFIVVGFFATLYYITSTVNNYSYSEKKWINDNKDKSLDIYVEKDLPVFSDNGDGVYYEYLKAFGWENTMLSFSPITNLVIEIFINVSCALFGGYLLSKMQLLKFPQKRENLNINNYG